MQDIHAPRGILHVDQRLIGDELKLSLARGLLPLSHCTANLLLRQKTCWLGQTRRPEQLRAAVPIQDEVQTARDMRDSGPLQPHEEISDLSSSTHIRTQ